MDEEQKNLAEEDDSQEKSSKCKRARCRLWVGIVLVVVAASVTMALIYLWHRHRDTQFEISQQGEVVAQLQQQQANFAKQLQQSDNTRAEMQRALSQLRLNKTSADFSWTLAEVSYLVRTAQIHLTTFHHPEVAKKLLITADKNLSSITNGSVVNVRQALAHTIAALDAIPPVDTEGLVLKINALSDAVAQLPLGQDKKLSDIEQTNEMASGSLTDWRDQLKQSLSSLKNVVVIRRLQEPVKPLVTPSQHALLVENIQLQLSIAQWALLQEQQRVYRNALSQAQQWLNEFFHPTSARDSIVSALNELQKINIVPLLPGLANVRQALDVAVNEITKEKGSSSTIAPSSQEKNEPKASEVLSS